MDIFVIPNEVSYSPKLNPKEIKIISNATASSSSSGFTAGCRSTPLTLFWIEIPEGYSNHPVSTRQFFVSCEIADSTATAQKPELSEFSEKYSIFKRVNGVGCHCWLAQQCYPTCSILC
jgi:hypothetical protein